jgi:TM2 domain-containing membrane protein YozV
MPVGTLPGDKSPGVAGLLSFLIPGVGQMYVGQVGRGVAWLACCWSAAVVTIILSLVVVTPAPDATGRPNTGSAMSINTGPASTMTLRRGHHPREEAMASPA